VENHQLYRLEQLVAELREKLPETLVTGINSTSQRKQENLFNRMNVNHNVILERFYQHKKKCKTARNSEIKKKAL